MSHLMVNVIPEATQVERRKLGSGDEPALVPSASL